MMCDAPRCAAATSTHRNIVRCDGNMAVGTWRNLLQVVLAVSSLSVIALINSSHLVATDVLHVDTKEHHHQHHLHSLATAFLPSRVTTASTSTESTDDDGSDDDSSSMTIPNFENGGIMVFYHVYKTGGSTVTGLMSDLAKADEEEEKYFFMRVRKSVPWGIAKMAVKRAANQNKTVMCELHVQYPSKEFPTLVELVPTLVKWRAEAERRGVPFFAFTVLREPVAHSISFFNFFHVAGRDDGQAWNPFRTLAPTEKNYLKSFQGNRQCHLMDADANGVIKSPVAGLRPAAVAFRQELPSYESDDVHRDENCRYRKVRDALFGTMDWVGTTESLQTETLPLLSTILLNDPAVGWNQTSKKVFSANVRVGTIGIKREGLSESTLAHVERETKLDRWLYEEARERFMFP
jgi:Sulfotransferase family